MESTSSQPCGHCGPTRRQVVQGVGTAALAGAVAPALGACGGGGARSETVPAADVPVGGGVIVGAFVVTQPAEGEFRAFEKTCPHAGCAVSGVVGETIVCDCHGSEFTTTDGTVAKGPATTGLTPATVTVDGDSLSVSA